MKTRKLSPAHKRALADGRRRKATERRREREERLQHLGIKPVSRKIADYGPVDWRWRGVKYRDLDSMISAMLELL